MLKRTWKHVLSGPRSQGNFDRFDLGFCVCGPIVGVDARSLGQTYLALARRSIYFRHHTAGFLTLVWHTCCLQKPPHRSINNHGGSLAAYYSSPKCLRGRMSAEGQRKTDPLPGITARHLGGMAALAAHLAHRGVFVTPIKCPGAEPPAPSIDRRQGRRWWRKWPGAAVGVACGPCFGATITLIRNACSHDDRLAEMSRGGRAATILPTGVGGLVVISTGPTVPRDRPVPGGVREWGLDRCAIVCIHENAPSVEINEWGRWYN